MMAIGSILIQLHCLGQDRGFPLEVIQLNDLSAFVTGNNWKIASDVFYDYRPGSKTIVTKGTGVVYNEVTNKTNEHLISKIEHGDIELELDFMMDKNSSAGVYLQGRYEVQMVDSWGLKSPKSTGCGAIAERWNETKPEGHQGYEGHPPAQNVSKAPGLWQHFRILFRAPRFDAKGDKIENARFISVEHNGVIIHQNVEVSGPTRSAIFNNEKPSGPLVIQGDQGPVAIKNIRYKAYGVDAITLADLRLSAYEGKFKSVLEFQSLKPTTDVKIDLLEHQGTESTDNFAGTITGNIRLPKAGKYFFQLNCKWIPDDTNPANPNGGGQFSIGNKIILTLDGKHGGIVSAVADFDAGVYPITLSYYKTYRLWYARSNDFVLSAETPGVPLTYLNSVLKSAEAVGAITVPVANEPVMQRSFVNHGGRKKTHVISIGEPGGVNYSMELSSGSLLQFWRGNFIETTLMWYGRGEPQLAQPLGSVIQLPGQPAFAFLPDKNAVWPDSLSTYNYVGYDVNAAGRPVFKYTIENFQVRELLESTDDGKQLSHTLTVTNLTKDGWCKVAEGTDIVKLPSGLYAINDKQYFIKLSDKAEPLLRKTSRKTTELLLPVKSGNSTEIKYSIIW